jgi:dolichyl-phosphate-mannose--protein O-mannosyl transferase
MPGEPQMAALVHALSQAFGTDAEIASLKIVAIVGGVVLLVTLFFMLSYLTYGLDLSPGFF